MIKNKKLKERMTKRFVNVAYDLSLEIGIEKLTIRNIADRAGYNSATIYNYFKNLDHLIFFAAMRHLKEYSQDLPHATKEAKNAMDIFMMVWDSFCKHAFEKPKVYNAIFFPVLDREFEDYISDYYELFPEDLADNHERIGTMLLKSDLTQRGDTTVQGIVEEAYISKEDADFVNNVTLLIFEAKLRRVIRGTISPEDAGQETMHYIKGIMEKFLIKDYTFHF